MDLYDVAVMVSRLSVLGVLGGALYAFTQRRRGPSFRAPAGYTHEHLVTPTEMATVKRALRQPLRTGRPNISDALARLARAIPALTHAELADALQHAEWDSILLEGPERGLAELRVHGIRRELTRRAARAKAAELDPHPLEVQA